MEYIFIPRIAITHSATTGRGYVWEKNMSNKGESDLLGDDKGVVNSSDESVGLSTEQANSTHQQSKPSNQQLGSRLNYYPQAGQAVYDDDDCGGAPTISRRY